MLQELTRTEEIPMESAVLVPPRNEEELREQAEQLRDDVDAVLVEDMGSTLEIVVEDEEQAEPPRARDDQWFKEISQLVGSVARSPAWQAHDLARELLITRDDLAEALIADSEGADPEWKQHAALRRMKVVIDAMMRQIQHHAIDRPEHAAHYVAEQLAGASDADVARLLGTTPRMVNKYRSEGVKEIRKDPDRVTLVGQLVYELHNSRTPRGVVMWFDAPREALDGRTPLELIDENVASAQEELVPLARGARGQLDTGRGAVE